MKIIDLIFEPFPKGAGYLRSRKCHLFLFEPFPYDVTRSQPIENVDDVNLLFLFCVERI